MINKKPKEESPYEKISKLLEKRFEEIQDLTEELYEIMNKMLVSYMDKNLMSIYQMNFNDKVEELREEYDLILAICNIYNFK